MNAVDDQRYHLMVTTRGRRAVQGWWGSEAVARRKFTTWVGEYGTLPDPRFTLVDEETGRVLTSWPDEP